MCVMRVGGSLARTYISSTRVGRASCARCTGAGRYPPSLDWPPIPYIRAYSGLEVSPRLVRIERLGGRQIEPPAAAHPAVTPLGSRTVVEKPEVLDLADSHWMSLAMEEARAAADANEVPVGAVVVNSDGEILGRGRNSVEADGDVTSHAELLALRNASRVRGGWRLDGTTMYVTLEPCPMCAAAILAARISRLVYGARSILLGADGSYVALLRPQEDECEEESEGSRCCGSDDNERRPTASKVMQPLKPHPFNPDIVVRGGVLGSEAAELMRDFFRRQRRRLQD